MAVYHLGLRATARKLTPRRLADTVRVVLSDEVLVVDWVNRGPVRENWGDAVAPLLVERLSGRPVVNHRDVFTPRSRTVYTTIGSMLGTVDAPRVTVWGSGFVDSRATLRCRPERVCAVRGPLTRAKLLDAGVDCPEVYGDPALLFPRIHRPERTAEFELGVIPHFREHELDEVDRMRSWDGVHVIDIRGGIRHVADQINRCRRIASSSLHGLVAADAYGIPAAWVRITDRPAGDGFKFRDYLASTGGRAEPPLEVTTSTTRDDVLERIEPAPMEVDVDGFLDACPFLDRQHFERRGAAPLADRPAGR